MRVRYRWVALLTIAVASLALSGIGAYAQHEFRASQVPTPSIDPMEAAAKPSQVGPHGYSADAPLLTTLPNYPPLLGPAVECFNFDDNATQTGGYYFIPPDPHDAVGTDHVINIGNVLIQWRLKSAPVLHQNLQSLQSFFSTLPPPTPPAQGTNLGTFCFDPKVIYDQYEDRFVVVALERWDTGLGATSDESRILVAVSQTSDPNAGWWFHAIDSKINISGFDHWADYPGLAIDDKAVYITNNMFRFSSGGGTFGGVRLWIIDKGPTYAGPDNSIAFTVHDPYASAGIAVTTQPSHMYGPIPAGSDGRPLGTFLCSYSGLTSMGIEATQVVEVTDPLGATGGPYFYQQYVPCGDIEGETWPLLPDALQLGSAIPIEVNDRRALNAVWRDDDLWVSATIYPETVAQGGPDVNQTTAHWWHLDATNPASITTADQGNVGAEDLGTATFTFFPSVMVDCDKNMAIGFSASNEQMHCGAYYASRMATDPAGYISTTSTLQTGTDYYVRTFGTGLNRWGDYSGLSLCPVDEATFWVYNEYACERGTAFGGEDGRWCTKLGKFRLKSLSVSECDVRIYHNETDQCVPVYAHLDTTILGEWGFDNAATCDAMGWTTADNSGRGDYAALYQGITVVQQDPCYSYLDCLWGFFDGVGITDYSCGGWPIQGAVPYGAPYMDNEILSPEVSLSGDGSSVILEFDVYRDLVFDELVFYRWRVRSFVNNKPTDWRIKHWCFYGPGRTKDWVRHVEEIGELVEPGADKIQIALGVVDMCGLWCGLRGLGDCHSHAPLIDNVRLLRIKQEGPVWNVRQIDLFQDNFPGDGTVTGTVRADMAKDIAPLTNPTIVSGDSICVWVGDLQNGIAPDKHTGKGPAVYCYVCVHPTGQPLKTPANLQAPEIRPVVGLRFPYTGPYVDSQGATWYRYRMDQVFVDATFTMSVPDRYCFDLNDQIFTPPDTVFFFFSAENGVGKETYWTEFHGTTTDPDVVTSCPMEFTCLPANGLGPGVDILYVDAFDGRGAQRFFDEAFTELGLEEYVDRYDQRGPSSLVNNGLGSRVTGVEQQLIIPYHKIIWNSGDLPVGTIGDGSMWPLKTDDFEKLFRFLDQHPDRPGIYFSGDNLGEEWSAMTGASAVQTRAAYMNYTLVSPDHVSYGEPIMPLLHGVGTIFVHGGVPDTVLVYGGCPKVNNFDLFEPTGLSKPELANSDTTAYYVLSQTTQNLAQDTARVVLSGFSFHYMTWVKAGAQGRSHHLRDILEFLQNPIQEPVAVSDKPQAVNYLANNRPNPFNPVTTIRYGIREPAHVSLKIYNVAGQLVKTLVDGFQSTRAGDYAVTWDGVDNAGQPVASGVYFYKLVTKGFTQTRKMVLLK